MAVTNSEPVFSEEVSDASGLSSHHSGMNISLSLRDLLHKCDSGRDWRKLVTVGGSFLTIFCHRLLPNLLYTCLPTCYQFSLYTTASEEE